MQCFCFFVWLMHFCFDSIYSHLCWTIIAWACIKELINFMYTCVILWIYIAIWVKAKRIRFKQSFKVNAMWWRSQHIYTKYTITYHCDSIPYCIFIKLSVALWHLVTPTTANQKSLYASVMNERYFKFSVFSSSLHTAIMLRCWLLYCDWTLMMGHTHASHEQRTLSICEHSIELIEMMKRLCIFVKKMKRVCVRI